MFKIVKSISFKVKFISNDSNDALLIIEFKKWIEIS